MKSILVPVEPYEFLDSALATAVLLANSFHSHIEGFPLSPALSPFLAADAIGATVVYNAEVERDDEMARTSQDKFESFMERHGLARVSTRGQPSFGWRDGPPAGEAFVGSHSRIFDITVVGRPGPLVPRMSTLEAALFESGRPILIAPPTAPLRLGESVMVAWNRSTETARAVALAMPVLKIAGRVVILTVEGGTTQGPSGDQVVGHLARHGISAEAISVDPASQTTGEAILSHAAEIGADLIVKGAYTQSRLRQMIFGGATRHIISETRLPVLMAH